MEEIQMDSIYKDMAAVRAEFLKNLENENGTQYAKGVDTLGKSFAMIRALSEMLHIRQAPQDVSEAILGLINAYIDGIIGDYFNALGFTEEQVKNVVDSANNLMVQLEKVVTINTGTMSTAGTPTVGNVN